MTKNIRRSPSPPRPSPAAGEGSSRRLRRSKSGGSTVVGIFIGLVIGVLIAFAVVLYLNKTPLPFQDKASNAERRDSVPGQAPLPLPGKPGDKALEKPRFDFYKILPGSQDAVPATTPAPAAGKAPAQGVAPSAAPAAAAAPAESIYLQAGAFQKAAEADNLKAKLTLLGFDTGVQEINVPDKGTLYRVRVGPFASVDEMNRVRGQLSQNGVQATVVKVKEASN
jgi:cell division protein FtsN